MMKLNRLFSGLVILAASGMAFTSCDSKVKLVKDIEGTWATNSDKLGVEDALNASATYLIEFTPNEGNDPLTGSVTLSALLNIVNMAAPSDMVEQAYSVSAGCTADVCGTYRVADDDELLITMDITTFNVDVDPAGVILEYNLVEGTDQPVANDTLSTVYAAHVKAQVTETIKQRFLSIDKIDDIHVKNDELKCEIMDHDLKFHRQSETEMVMKK